jgi:OHCU decarboxylase
VTSSRPVRSLKSRINQEDIARALRADGLSTLLGGILLVVCVRENRKETILASGKERLENSPAQEKAAGLVEIIKIANLRLQDIIEIITTPHVGLS